MSAYNTGSTYQSIVIAIVAGGIVSAGIMSIVWRRRARRRWMEARRRLPPGGDERMSGWMDGWDVGSGAGGRGRRGGGGVGREPGIWDVILAGEEEEANKGKEVNEDEEGQREEKQVKVLDEQEKLAIDQGSERQDMFKWKPTSLSLSLSPKAPTKPAFASPLARPSNPETPSSHLAEITVLVAMPDPDAPGPSRRQLQSSPDDPNDVYRYISRAGEGDDAEEEEYLPPLEIGSSSITIQTNTNQDDKGGGGGGVDILEEMFKTAQSERKDDKRKRGERERGDDPWSDIPLGEATRDPLASPSAAARFAVIRYGALSGFAGQGQTRTNTSSSSHVPGPPPSFGGA